MEVLAPAHWTCIDFISDLHLQMAEAATFLTWQQYLQHTQADALFILGDLFEVWLGDDMLDLPTQFEARCAELLQQTAQRMPVYMMHGNRDFLMEERLMQAAGSTLLDDPSVLSFGGLRWMLCHGDAWCLNDRTYMQFRELVRSPDWQRDFLAKPLTERYRIAREIRAQSEANRQAGDTLYADVDHNTAIAAMQTGHAHHLIHGHTHHPARHDLGDGRQRWVLSDWELSARTPRAEVLRLRLHTQAQDTPRVTLERIPPTMA